MTDLYSGFIFVALATVAAFAFGLRIARDARPWIRDVLALTTVGLMAAYIHFLWDNVWVTRLLPVSNVVIVGNWFPLLAGLLAGIAWHRVPGHWARKAFSVLALAAAAVYSSVFPLLGEPPTCDNQWANGVCLQTSPSSCSAACAATMLAAYGIDATEQEMAELCLTRNGTTWSGLYHGLSVKTRSTQWKPEIFVWDDIEELRSSGQPAIILSIELKPGVETDPKYSEDWGYIPGVLHAVLCFGFLDLGAWEIGDPMSKSGREYWMDHDIRVLWHGKGMRLIDR
ncbi:MAG: cysteine peptidase family C39 domain-containing protein [Planctomycetota bacterium]|nr:cysteine peptidase family C39 domain-containing protein [Planctomycetota bacterium]